MTSRETLTGVSLMTLPISIKTITVGRKMMTRGFITQISEEALIDPQTGAFVGVPLGRINLHDRDCKAPNTPDHLHVLWLKDGDSLRRTRVFRRDVASLFSNQFAMARFNLDDVTKALACTVYMADGEAGLETYFERDWSEEMQGEILAYVYFPASDRTRGKAHCPANSLFYRGDEQRIINSACSADEIPALIDLVRQRAYELECLENKAKGIYTTLGDLPQLFIAG